MSHEENDAIVQFVDKYRFLSNFFPARISFGTILYPSVEHAFQAAKTTSTSRQEDIAKANTPAAAKKLGKDVDLREDWNLVKFSIMRDLLRLKFADPTLKKLLLETGDRKLIEGNTWGDKIWGCVKINGKWFGQNKLGLLLEEVREELKNSEKSSTIERT